MRPAVWGAALLAASVTGTALALRTDGWDASFWLGLAILWAAAATAVILDEKGKLVSDQSPTAPGVIRRRAARLAQLGIIAACVPDDERRPRTYAVTTTGGDTTTRERRDMPAYLDGLAHGAHAEAQR